LGSTAYLESTRSSRAAVTPSRDIENPYELTVTRPNPNEEVFLYNGNTTGPTIRAFSWLITIAVELINDMPALDDDCVPDINEELRLGTPRICIPMGCMCRPAPARRNSSVRCR